MRTFLIRMNTYGIKSIENKITIDFYPKTVKKNMSINGNNVKGIYGMNGSGKSSIIHSVDFYNKLVTSRNYLSNRPHSYLNNLINKHTKSFYCEMIYAIYEKNDENKIYNIYSHIIKISLLDNHYEFVYEKLSLLVEKTINGKYETIFEVINGDLNIFGNGFSDLKSILIEKSKNLLNQNSFINFFENWESNLKDENSSKNIDGTNLFIYLYSALLFNHTLDVHIENEDDYSKNYNISKQIEKFIGSSPAIIEKYFLKNSDSLYGIGSIVVNKDSVINFEDQIIRLENFIKIFKPSIKQLKYNKRVNFDNYFYNLIFKYDDYEVDLEFESTGIKKLVKLFDAFESVNSGRIVFIDELDANLHDVYLSNLIKYFSEYAEGQLCFTTHNLGTIKELSKFKNSIDFISENCEIVPWIKNGNYDPFTQYRGGMIKGSPFNVEPFDFLKVFKNGD